MPGLPRRTRILLIATVLALVAGIVLVLVVPRPRTVTDIGPLTLPPLPEAPEGAEVLLAVGDIGFCGGEADDVVAELAASLPGTIALLGDTVYPSGSATDFTACFEPSWGPMRPRLHPAIGNHEYDTGDASAYWDWFGDRAGTAGEGWYSYSLGDWHVVVLNSNCGVVSCAPGSPQLEWLAADLAAHPGECLLAYWHHPRFSSGRHGSSAAVAPLWDAVLEAGVDVVLAGHDHSYERVEVDGVQQFIVGTGGRSLYGFERDPLPGSAARHDTTYGLLWLALGEGTYEWQFLPVGVTVFADSGSGEC